MRIGVDLGGTKIEAAALSDDGKIAARLRRPTPQHDYAATLEAIGATVRDAEKALGLAEAPRIGVAMPGAISPRTGLVKNANSVWLNGKPFDRDLAAHLKRDVRVANDANCLALSEAHDGAAAGARTVFAVIMGTGTGGGLVVDGRIVTGANAIAGEWGHNPLPWPDAGEQHHAAPCYCGKTGCIETYISGPGFARFAANAFGVSGDAQQIAARADAGDPGEVAAVSWLVRATGKALASVCNIVDPDVIVLGGGLSNLAALYRDVPGVISDFAFSDGVTVRLVPALHGDSSGVRGAAWLWPAP